jgi:NAD(P)H dehydrogenase (quinone)
MNMHNFDGNPSGGEMTRILIGYHSRTGNTEAIAEAIAQGAGESAEVTCMRIEDLPVEAIVDYDAIILGSPVYFGTCSAEMKRFIDGTVRVRGKLVDKIGAAFTTSGGRTGGKETTIFSILQAMFIHGMVVIGDPMETGGHYGIAVDGGVSPEDLDDAVKYGRRIAAVTQRCSH